MFKRRFGWFFLGTVAIVCATWLRTVSELKEIQIPKWGIGDIMNQRIWMYNMDLRITNAEANIGLMKELEKFRIAMKPFVKSQACKIYVR